MFDGDGAIVPDCMLEIGRRTLRVGSPIRRTSGRCRTHSFKGFGRVGTDANGAYAFDTIKPGPVPDPDGKPQAPHIVLAVYARGMLLVSLFADLFRRRGRQCRRSRADAGAGRPSRDADLDAAAGRRAVYRLDIHLQGDNETVFFDV